MFTFINNLLHKFNNRLNCCKNLFYFLLNITEIIIYKIRNSRFINNYYGGEYKELLFIQ